MTAEDHAEANQAKGSGATPLCTAVDQGHGAAARRLHTEGHTEVNQAEHSGAALCHGAE